MDYLFYGNIATSKKPGATTISLTVYCEPDESLQLYEFSPDASHHLVYRQIPTERGTDKLTATFDVQDDRLFLFIIAGQSNEVNIPFEVTYAVYNGEVVSLPENDVVKLEGTTYVSLDGRRERAK